MKYGIVFSPESNEDLARIYRRIARNGFPMNAEAFVTSISEFCMSLQSFPKRGTPRDDLAAGLRVLGFREQAVIAFDVDDQQQRVNILRVFGRGQSIEEAFDEKAIQ